MQQAREMLEDWLRQRQPQFVPCDIRARIWQLGDSIAQRWFKSKEVFSPQFMVVLLPQFPIRGRTFVMKFLQVSGIITLGVCLCLAAPAATDRSPLSVAVSLDGKTLYVSDKTSGCVTTLDEVTVDAAV